MREHNIFDLFILILFFTSGFETFSYNMCFKKFKLLEIFFFLKKC